MSHVGSDLRLAVRTLLRRPAFTLLAVLTLTIGVGANTAVFVLINATFLRPLPLLREPERLVEINRRVGNDFVDVSYRVFQAMRAERGVLVDAAAYTPLPVSVAAETRSAAVVRMAVSTTGNYFDVLGVRPALGRFFALNESFHPTVSATAVISDRLWRDQFGADPHVLGRVLRVNGVPLEIIGVTPAAFRGHATGLVVDAYLPVGLTIPGLPTAASLNEPRSDVLQVIARLAPDVSTTVAASALGAAVTRDLATAPRPAPARRSDAYAIRVDAFSPVPVVIRDGVAAFLGVLLGISGLLAQTYFYIDNLFVRAICGDKPLGHYNVAVRVLSASIMLAQYASLAALPWFTRCHQEGSLGPAVARLTAPLFALSGLMCGLIWPWAEPLLELFKPGFGAAADALRWLLLATLAIYVGALLLTGVVAIGDSRSMLWIAAAGLAVNIGLNAWLVPAYGIEGAGAATLATETSVTLGAWWALRRAGVHPWGHGAAWRWAGGPALFGAGLVGSRWAAPTLAALLGLS